MALQIRGDIGAVAIELIRGLHHDLRAGLTCAGAVLVYSALDANVDPLGILAAEGGGTAGPVGPLTAYHDDAVPVCHLGMDDIALSVGQDLAGLETESLLQPLERRAIIFVGERRDEGGAGCWGAGHGRFPSSFPNSQ